MCIDVEDENFFDFHGNLFLENEKILRKPIIPKTHPGALDSCVVYSWVVATLWFWFKVKSLLHIDASCANLLLDGDGKPENGELWKIQNCTTFMFGTVHSDHTTGLFTRGFTFVEWTSRPGNQPTLSRHHSHNTGAHTTFSLTGCLGHHASHCFHARTRSRAYQKAANRATKQNRETKVLKPRFLSAQS